MSTKQNDIWEENKQEMGENFEAPCAEEESFLKDNPEDTGEMTDIELAHLKGAPPESNN